MGGRLSADSDPRRGLSLAVELPFAIDQASLAVPLDLAHLPVLIVTKDADFVGDLIEPLEAWRADPRWSAPATRRLPISNRSSPARDGRCWSSMDAAMCCKH